MDDDQDRTSRRAKLIGRIILVVFGLLIAVYLAPLFLPALRPG